jgi:Fe-S cluster biogenesis protein NfuA
MPSWFKKVFQSTSTKPASAVSGATLVSRPPSLDEPALGKPDTGSWEPERPKLRRIINAPVIMPEEEQTAWSDDIRIKARVEKDMMSCVFMVDRPVLDGLSAWLPSPEWSEQVSPLAARLFRVEGVGGVLLHNFTVTITMAYNCKRTWEDLAAAAGPVIREHLKSGQPVMTEEFMAGLPSEDEIRRRVQECVDLEINPGIASHSGVVTLERVEGNTVYITMGGGCQGCAASTITLRQGIHTAFRQAVPQIGAIYDETDHAAGKNPYYRELPAGMA